MANVRTPAIIVSRTCYAATSNNPPPRLTCMIELYIPTDELPFAFFKALDISWESIARKMIQNSYHDFTEEECDRVVEYNGDCLLDTLSEMKFSDSIKDYWFGDEEADGTMGT